MPAQWLVVIVVAAVVAAHAEQDWTRDSVTIPAGSRTSLLIAAANRDPLEFPDPDRLDPRRPNLQHSLTFGHGIRQCAGMHLARAEIRIVLEQVTSRYSSMAPVNPAVRAGSQGMFPAAYSSIPVRLWS